MPSGKERDLVHRGQSLTATHLESEKLAEAKQQAAAFKPQIEYRESLSLQGP